MDRQTRTYQSLMRFYEAEARYSASGSRADRDSLLATLHPEISLYQPDSLPYGGRWEGRKQFGRWLDAFAETWTNITPIDPKFYSCDEETLVSIVTMRARARATDVEIDMPMCQIIRFSDELPFEWRNFAWDTARMLHAIGPEMSGDLLRDRTAIIDSRGDGSGML